MSVTERTRSGSMTVSLITKRVSNLFVGSAADAAWVLMKKIVAIVGLPKSSKIVIDVELFEDLSSLSSVYITSNNDKNELETLKIDNEIN